MNDPDGPEKLRRIKVERHEPVCSDILAHNAFGHDADSRPVSNGLFDHHQIVEAKSCLYTDTVITEITVNLTLYGQVIIKSDERGTTQVSGGKLLAPG